MQNKAKRVLFPLAALSLIGFLSACDNGSDSSSSLEPDDSSSSVIPDSSSSEEPTVPDEITGTGTETDPYVISSAKQYGDFVKAYNALTEAPAYSYYVLGDDFSLKGMDLSPVGTQAVPFYGSFDGNGHTISDYSLKSFDKSTTAYGLFGYADSSAITDLSLTIDYELAPLGAKSKIYVGGLIGNGYNTIIYDVAVAGSIDLTSGQNTSSQLIIGGVAGMLTAGKNYAIPLANNAAHVDINSDMTDAADTINMVGGIAGALLTDTDYKAGTIGVLFAESCYYSGSLTGGTAVGGIVATVGSRVSVLDCYAEGAAIKTTDTDGSYVGGIVGQGYYESAILHNYSAFDSIEAAASSSTIYKSYAGTSIGYAYKNGYDESDSTLGTVNYGNAAKEVTVVSDKAGVNGAAAEKGEAGMKAAGLSATWSIDKDGDVDLGYYIERSESVSVKLDANYEGGTSETITAANGKYDVKAIGVIDAKVFEREHYSYVGMFYDEEGQQPYTWYTPFVADTTLYASYGDLSVLVGTWNYTVGSVSGIWHFTEDTFYWQNRYYETSTYKYSFDGTYIFIGKYTGDSKDGGGYEGEIFKLENGKLVGYDINDYDYQYTAVKSTSTFVVPDYSGESFIGTYYFTNDAIITLQANGNAVGVNSTSTTKWYGGFTKLSSGLFNIRVPSRLMADGLNYDATNDIFYNDSYFGAKEKIETTYTTADSSIKVYSTASHNYAIVDGTIGTISGTLADGEEVVINDVTYAVNGTSLVKKEATPSIPESICGTYVSSTNNVMVLNQDGTGTWNGTAFTWSYDATEDKGYISAFGDFDGQSNWVKFNEDGSVNVHLEDERLGNVVNQALSKQEEKGEETVAGYVGTWIATRGKLTMTIVLNADGTGTYNNEAITYKESNGTITFECGDTEVELKYDSATGKMTGKYVYDYEDYPFDSITKQN